MDSDWLFFNINNFQFTNRYRKLTFELDIFNVNIWNDYDSIYKYRYKIFFPEKYRDKIDNNEKIKEKLSRIKYSTIIYIPILYISLLFSEKISVSNNFIYLVNKMTSSHYEEASQEFFSIYTFFSGILKLIFITLGWIVFIEYKDIFLTKVTRSLIGKVKEIENLSISNGKYYKIRCSKRKWNIDKSVFY